MRPLDSASACVLMRSIVGTLRERALHLDGRELVDEAATLAAGAELASLLEWPCVVGLVGDLGAGKTTLVRGLLRAVGVTGPIRSPTYTLVESYDTKLGVVHHLDCYRLRDSAEFEERGGPEYVAGVIALIEWPERVADRVRFDLTLALAFSANGRLLRVLAGGPDGAA